MEPNVLLTDLRKAIEEYWGAPMDDSSEHLAARKVVRCTEKLLDYLDKGGDFPRDWKPF